MNTTTLQSPVALSAPRAARVLVVDDDDQVRASVARLAQRFGHEVTAARDGSEALAAMSTGAFDAICSDIHMPGMTGLELLRAVRERDLDVPVLLLTGGASLGTAVEAVQYGAFEYLTKPVDMARFEQSLKRAIALGRIARAKREATSDRENTHGAGDRAGLEASFDRAMRTMWTAFQPIVTREGTLYGHESLLRSREPSLPHPGAVLDAAEKLGRVQQVGRHTRALAAGAVLLATETGALFVNLHPEDLFDPDLTDPTAALTKIASRVVLELTERASIDDLANLRERVAELRAVGYRIAIDDLGAGYAGLSALALLEPDVVKLDMSLIRGVDTSRTKQRLVESITRASKDLGMLVVAEGVETEPELASALALGCDLIQGYLLARPGPAFPSYVWPRVADHAA